MRAGCPCCSYVSELKTRFINQDTIYVEINYVSAATICDLAEYHR